LKICFHADFQLRSFCYAKTPAKAFYTAASMPPKARNEKMKVNGCDCSIVIKTTHKEFDVPYSEETIREAVSILQEEASIEGDGVCRAIQKKMGVTGCVVTPLTIGTAPLLLYLAMGSVGKPVFVSETRDLYRYQLNLLPLENSDYFDLIQDRTNSYDQLTINNERKLFERCRVKGFELRFEREQVIKLKIDITSERSAVVFPYMDTFKRESGERFNSDNVSYDINGMEYKNIYGLTLIVKKEGGTKTEIWVKRILQNDIDLPNNIEKLVLTARLIRDKYDCRNYGVFRITLKRLVLVSDETNVNSTDTVIGPIRYYVSGTVSTEVFTSGEGGIG